MARNNVRLINYHTSGTTAPKIEDMAVGEIAVGKDLIWSKHNANEELSVFISSGAVHSAITAAETTLKGITDSLSTRITTNTNKKSEYPTSAETVAADTKTLEDAKSYTDLLKAKKGETYDGETLAGLQSEINSLKNSSDTTVGALTSRVTQAEKDIDALEKKVGDSTTGLVKDVADLKTTVGNSTTGLVKDVADLNTKIDAVSGASSAYTDSQINAIKGGETKATLSSLKSDIDNQGSAISGITNGTKLDSFKDVEDEINSKISSVYKVRGTKNTYAELPTEGNTIGDVYNVVQAVGTPGTADYTPAGTNYVCTTTTGTRKEQWDALGGTIDLSPYATKTITDGLKSRLDIAETNIGTLTTATDTLNTSITTIQGWKINDKFISGSPILNGTDIKVDDAENAQTLKVAIVAAKNAGDSAMDYAKGVSGSVKTLNTTVDNNKTKIDAYTVNGTPISANPVLTGENVLVGGTSEDKAKTLNTTIAEAKEAGTTAQTNLTTLKGSYSGTLVTLSNKVDTNEQKITQLRTDVDGVSATTITAVQTITVTNTETNKLTATKAKGSTEVVLNFDNMVINCGEF